MGRLSDRRLSYAGEVRILTRNLHDWTNRLPAIVEAVSRLDRQKQTSEPAVAAAWLIADDDELVAVDALGLDPFLAPAGAVGTVAPTPPLPSRRNTPVSAGRPACLQFVAEDDVIRSSYG